MRRFIFLLIILIISVFIGFKIAEDPGYAIFAYRHWTMEMPLWFAIVSLVLGLLILYFLLRFLDAIDASWHRWKNWLRLRRKHKAYSKTNRGLIELIEANWRSAETYLMEGVDQSDAPLINFLAAAYAAHQQGAYDKQDIYLRKAYDLSPQMHVPVGIMQAELQLKQKKYEQALATLKQLHAEAPKQPQVLKLLERIYIHLGDWKNLLNLIPKLRKAKLITLEQADMLENKTYQELLHASKTASAAREIWHSMPRKLQKNPDSVCDYAKALLRYPDTQEEVNDSIIKTLKKGWHPELVLLYGVLKTGNPMKQLKIAETWQKTFGMHAELSLTLARLSLRAEIWGKSKAYFEESLKLGALPQAYIEYGNLLQQLNESHAALQVYRNGLVLAEKYNNEVI